jgi:hypothetical protein
LALDGGEWSSSHPGRFTSREKVPGTHWIGYIKYEYTLDSGQCLTQLQYNEPTSRRPLGTRKFFTINNEVTEKVPHRFISATNKNKANLQMMMTMMMMMMMMKTVRQIIVNKTATLHYDLPSL